MSVSRILQCLSWHFALATKLKFRQRGRMKQKAAIAVSAKGGSASMAAGFLRASIISIITLGERRWRSSDIRVEREAPMENHQQNQLQLNNLRRA